MQSLQEAAARASSARERGNLAFFSLCCSEEAVPPDERQRAAFQDPVRVSRSTDLVNRISFGYNNHNVTGSEGMTQKGFSSARKMIAFTAHEATNF